jgi:hypothetical protein
MLSHVTKIDYIYQFAKCETRNIVSYKFIISYKPSCKSFEITPFGATIIPGISRGLFIHRMISTSHQPRLANGLQFSLITCRRRKLSDAGRALISGM